MNGICRAHTKIDFNWPSAFREKYICNSKRATFAERSKVNLKVKIHTFFKCIYYRAYSMVGIIIHLMCVKSLQLACN